MIHQHNINTAYHPEKSDEKFLNRNGRDVPLRVY